MNIPKVPLSELNARINAFRKRMDEKEPDWRLAFIIRKINQFYFTGTMQQGVLVIPRDDEAVLYVRRSCERALDESLFPNIRPISSYRDIKLAPEICKTVYIETEAVPVAMLERIKKYIPISDVKPLDSHILWVRAVKSEYELEFIKIAGQKNQFVLEKLVPPLLVEGVSETELFVQLYPLLLKEGHHGLIRYSMFDNEATLGQFCFGESSIYPTSFDGPGGALGICPAVPMMGSRERRLKKGDLVFVDYGFGYNGYHTDKTTTFVFKGSLPDEAVRLHEQCVKIQNDAAAMLRPGAIPSEIYRTVIKNLDPALAENFMGYAGKKAKFLGHGVGLTSDDYPVIADGFDEPLEEGMCVALEPKCGVKDVGMVGIENTFLVTKNGGISLTGTDTGLIPVY